MHIGPLRPVTAPTAPKATAHGEAPAFPRLGSAETAVPVHVTGKTLLAPSLTLFLDEEPKQKRRRDATKARRLLDGLDSVRRALVGGNLSNSQLDQLAGELSSAERPIDPDMAALFDEIAVRVAVEVAKREA